MKWKRTKDGVQVRFAGHSFCIVPHRLGWHLWCYEISDSWHWTTRGAKRQALEDAVGYALYELRQNSDLIGELQEEVERLKAGES